MDQCKVWLDNYTGQYYPGSTVQGRVIVTLTSQTTLRSIKVRINTREHTEWMGEESYLDPVTNERRDRPTLLIGDNDPFSTELIIYGGQSGTTALSSGQHIYPFSINLPLNIPGTFNCEHGHISYILKAIVDRPMALDYQDEIVLQVIAPVDLNMLRKPNLLEPTSYSDDKTLCCLCCAQGPVSLDVGLPKRTLVPGETVNVTARLTNMSNTNVEGVSFELKQRITCKVTSPTSDEMDIDNVLVSIQEVGLGAHGEHTYVFPVMLPMDAIIPNFTNCKLFQVEYKYKVIAELPGVHTNLAIEMYPEIGNISIGQISAPPESNFNAPGAVYPPADQKGYPPYPQGGLPPMGFVPPPGAVSVYPPGAPSAPPSEGVGSEQPPPSYDSLLQKQ